MECNLPPIAKNKKVYKLILYHKRNQNQENMYGLYKYYVKINWAKDKSLFEAYYVVFFLETLNSVLGICNSYINLKGGKKCDKIR